MAGGLLSDTLVLNELLSAACLLSNKLQAGLAVLSHSARHTLSLHSVKEDVKLSVNQELHAGACTQGHKWEWDCSDPGMPKYSTAWVETLFPSGLKENTIITLTCLPPSANTAATNA